MLTGADRGVPPRRGGRRAVTGALAVVTLTVASACGSVSADSAPNRSSIRRAETPAMQRVHPVSPPRVLIFGDSIAGQHGSAAAFALRDAGVDTHVIGLWGSSLISPGQYDMGRTQPDPPALSLMAAATREVTEFEPDVIAVYVNHNYWPPYPRDAEGTVIERGSEAFAAMLRTQIAELVRRLSTGGARIFLVEPPPEGPGTTSADNAIWTAYLDTQADLGFEVIDSGDVLAAPDGSWVNELPDCAGRPTATRPPDDLHLTYFGAGLMGTATANALAEAVDWPVSGLRAPTQTPAAMLPMGTGYRLVTCDGGTFRFGVGGDPFGGLAPEGGLRPGEPVVAAATALDGEAAWLLTGPGRVRPVAGAPHLGDAALAAGDRAVAMAATPSGAGYWIATAGGAVQGFGDAEPLGDLAGGPGGSDGPDGSGGAGEADGSGGSGEADGRGSGGSGEADGRGSDRSGGSGGATGGGGSLGADTVVAIVAAPDGGYWLATAGGRVAAFGGAPELGDLRQGGAPAPIVAMAAPPAGGGYWLLDGTGRVHAFGGAADHGSANDQPMAVLTEFRSVDDYDVGRAPAAGTTAVAMLPSPSGAGYWVWMADGAVCAFGDAHPFGGLHRAEVDEIMLYKQLPYYGDGPCRQSVGFGAPGQ